MAKQENEAAKVVRAVVDASWPEDVLMDPDALGQVATDNRQAAEESRESAQRREESRERTVRKGGISRRRFGAAAVGAMFGAGSKLGSDVVTSMIEDKPTAATTTAGAPPAPKSRRAWAAALAKYLVPTGVGAAGGVVIQGAADGLQRSGERAADKAVDRAIERDEAAAVHHERRATLATDLAENASAGDKSRDGQGRPSGAEEMRAAIEKDEGPKKVRAEPRKKPEPRIPIMPRGEDAGRDAPPSR